MKQTKPLSNYVLCKNALIANNWGSQDAMKIAKRITDRKGNWESHLRNFLNYGDNAPKAPSKVNKTAL